MRNSIYESVLNIESIRLLSTVFKILKKVTFKLFSNINITFKGILNNGSLKNDSIIFIMCRRHKEMLAEVQQKRPSSIEHMNYKRLFLCVHFSSHAFSYRLNIERYVKKPKVNVLFLRNVHMFQLFIYF